MMSAQHPSSDFPLPPSRYKYSKLSTSPQQFRLLQIPKTASNARCSVFSLTAVPINNPPPYFALSYSWGPPEDGTQDNGQNLVRRISLGSGYFDIFENLDDALQQLCSRPEQGQAGSAAPSSLYLWVDAICINQQDLAERSQQVGLMDIVFSRASKVTIWLGRDVNNTMPVVSYMLSRFMNMFDLVNQAPDSTGRSLQELIRRHQHEYLAASGLPQIQDPQWLCLLGFFRRRWFSRLWVIQEMALAKDIEIVCGSTVVEWFHLEVCSIFLYTGLEHQILQNLADSRAGLLTFHSQIAATLADVRRYCTDGILPSSLVTMYRLFTGALEYDPQLAPAAIISIAYGFSATDPRDKVYALLGIIKQLTSSSETFVNVDYSKDETQVYTDVAHSILTMTNWLGFVGLADGAAATRRPSLPSWVPDLGDQVPGLLYTEGSPVFDASGKFVSKLPRPAPSLTCTDALLYVAGCKVSIIQSKSEPLDDFYEHESDLEHGIKLILDLGKRYAFTRQGCIEVLWRTMVVNNLGNSSPADYYASFSSWWLKVQLARAVDAHNKGISIESHLATIPNVELLAEADDSGRMPGHQAILKAFDRVLTNRRVADESRAQGLQYSSEVGQWVTSRRLFGTTAGHIGMGRETLREGDEVWIFPCGPVPLILRRVASAESRRRYILVGECSVHGIMQGEHFKHMAPTWEEIVLE